MNDGVLILGSGYVGSEVSKHLKRYQLNCDDIYLRGRSELNYHDQSVLRKFIRNNNIGYLINCAGFTGRP